MEDSSLLLEEIAEKAGCSFLSDLHQVGKKADILRAIDRIPHNLYTGRGWRDTASYISGQDCSFDTEPEIRRYLSDYCKDGSDK
ncbi:hypothetical protein [Anaerovorax odorimutans]|nr:hypothetical protein [Anaerovorax odorimutans]